MSIGIELITERIQEMNLAARAELQGLLEKASQKQASPRNPDYIPE